MFKISGKGTHFWLKEGHLTTLLTSGDVTLSGKTFNRPSTGHQWFQEFVLSAEGHAVLDVAMIDGKTEVKLDGKLVQTGKASDARAPAPPRRPAQRSPAVRRVAVQRKRHGCRIWDQGRKRQGRRPRREHLRIRG